MKRILSTVFKITCLLLLSSCTKQFLDKAPGVDVTENTVFSSRVNLDLFITTTYKYAVHSVFRYRDQENFSTTVSLNPGGNTNVIHPTSDITDEGDASEAPFANTNFWNVGNVTPANIIAIEDYRYYIRWIALRQIALIIKRINEVPDADEAYKNQVVGEVKLLRAMNYMEMLKRYGGVPLIDSVFEAGAQINVPRSTVEETINFILKDVNDAIANPDLPAAQTAALKGRGNKAAAYALKAKVLLFAASPQFNTATAYLSFSDAANNKLVCYGNYDLNRWKLAADAAKTALDYCLGNGYALIDDPEKRNPPVGATGATGNYRNSWELYNNTEFIFGYQGNNASNLSNAPLTFWAPKCYGAFWSGISVPLNFIRKYEKLDGTPMTWEISGGNDLLAKYAQLDPRFKQTINYTTSYFNAANPISQIFNGGKDYAGCLGGNWMRKYIPGNAAGGGSVFLNDILFRVNEIYLYYAEALNEFSGPSPDAYAAVNAIRRRSGMPGLPAGLSQAAFRQRVRNEIDVELVFDDHRMWNIRRWLIAENEGVMKGKFEGLQINKAGALYTWLPYTFETRVFNTNMYLHPFPQPEVLKGNLVQNPGW